MILKVTHRFNVHENIFLTREKELWKKSSFTNKKFIPARKLEMKLHQGKMKYYVNRRWLSLETLNKLSYPVNEYYKV